MKNINASKETILRTVVVFLTLINQFLVMFGKEKLPFTEEEIYQGLSVVVTVGATLWAWWKNNSFTSVAVEADRYKEDLKTVTKEDLDVDLIEEEEPGEDVDLIDEL